MRPLAACEATLSKDTQGDLRKLLESRSRAGLVGRSGLPEYRCVKKGSMESDPCVLDDSLLPYKIAENKAVRAEKWGLRCIRDGVEPY
jgi:hypothetical protein